MLLHDDLAREEGKNRILFVYFSLSSFVRKDLEILEKHFNVKRIKVRANPFPIGEIDPWACLKLLRGILWADVVFCWFADLNAFVSVAFSALFRKKSLVVVGGYEAVYVPEIDYGAFANCWSAVLVRFVFKHADKIFVVAPHLKDCILRNTGLDIEKKIEVVPTGYDYNRWKPNGQRENLVVTVVRTINWSTLRIKGLEIFVKVAGHFPDVKFILVGEKTDDSVEYLRSRASANVYFSGFLRESELITLYQKTKVYCQLSRHEGLPNALCEAMLCGCVPVGTRHGGIPTAIGDAGFYVPYGDVEHTAEAIRKALNADKERSEAARKRIKRLFPFREREKELIRHINCLVES